MRYGLALRKAHEVVDRLARGESVAAQLQTDERQRAISELNRMAVAAAAIVKPVVNVRTIRERLGLSQEEFATRFGLEPSTVRNWEQGRNEPDPAAQLLLKIIDTNPQAVERALTDSP